MIVQGLAFYLFAFVAVASGVMVISARNPVHSVLFLILAFFNSAGLFVLMGAEFLAMILVVVYVGAVAVLFLFVVMMLDINFAELRQGFLQYMPIGALIGIILLAELLVILGSWIAVPETASVAGAPIPPPAETSNTLALGRLLHPIHLFLPGGGSHPFGRDGWRDRPDAPSTAGCPENNGSPISSQDAEKMRWKS